MKKKLIYNIPSSNKGVTNDNRNVVYIYQLMIYLHFVNNEILDSEVNC